MLSLILKDILVQKKSFLVAVFYGIFFVIVFRDAVFINVSYVMSIVAIAYIFMMTACSYDDKNSSDIFLNSLPIKRSTIVKAKFLSMILYTVLATLLMAVIGFIISAADLPLSLRPIRTEDVIGALFAIGFLGSLYYPVYFKFGTIKARFFNIIIFLLFFFIPGTLVGQFMAHQDKAWAQGLADFFKNTPDWMIGSLLILVTIGLMGLSFILSLQVYRNKDL